MKKFVTLMLVLALAFSFFGFVGSAQAAARQASWVVSVTYQNVGTAATHVSVDFYSEGNGTPVTFDPLGGNTIAPGAGKSFFIGSVSELGEGFRGNAVMSAEQPLVATVVQYSQDAGFKVRLLYNGFKTEDGSDQYLIATTLGNTFSNTTIFSVQNIENEAINATVNFYNTSGQLTGTPKVWPIPANSSKYIEVDVPAITGLPSGTFNGSAIITAVTQDDGSPANVVAAVSELSIVKNIGGNFEGVPLSRAANTIYLATSLCQAFHLDTNYAVQNASLSQNATITVTYYNPDGTQKTTDGPYQIGPGQKKSIRNCAPNSGANMAGFTGSAKIVSTGAPIVAIGKGANSQASPSAGTADIYTIFNGEPTGYTKLALPFIRWANDADFNSASNTGGRQRATLAIQNLSQTTTAEVDVKYYGKNGDLIATQHLSIPANAKRNSSPAAANALGQAGMVTGSFGYYTDNTFGGAVIIESTNGQPLIAIARLSIPGFGEDYNGVFVP
jgi:hypothetical protein